MCITRDEVFVCQGRFDCLCRCRLRVWEERGQPPLALFSQLADYNGPSVTNRIESLAWEVFRQMGQPATGLIVLQHYPDRGPWRNGKPVRPATVDAVTFARTSEGFSDPSWQPVSRKDLAGLPIPLLSA